MDLAAGADAANPKVPARLAFDICDMSTAMPPLRTPEIRFFKIARQQLSVRTRLLNANPMHFNLPKSAHLGRNRCNGSCFIRQSGLDSFQISAIGCGAYTAD